MSEPKRKAREVIVIPATLPPPEGYVEKVVPKSDLNWDTITPDELFDIMVDGDYNSGQIAYMFDISTEEARAKIKRFGIKQRDVIMSRVIRNYQASQQ